LRAHASPLQAQIADQQGDVSLPSPATAIQGHRIADIGILAPDHDSHPTRDAEVHRSFDPANLSLASHSDTALDDPIQCAGSETPIAPDAQVLREHEFDLNGAVASAGRQQAVPSIQRFASDEHQKIGDEASGGAALDIDLGDGDKLTYGQMVALAADYFGSLDELRQLATTPEGRARLRWTRWWALKIGSEPPLDDTVKKQVRDRYYQLAAANISHFSAGGTARSEYERVHQQALAAAFAAGATDDERKWPDAMTTEAFSNHYLTDMFSAGHVRTPRSLIKEWYTQRYPDSVGQFVTYTAHWMTTSLDQRGDIPAVVPNSYVEGEIRAKILELGGTALQGMSIGDIVSLALHDHDNEGLNVVSDADASGTVVAGGYHWRAIGDTHLSDNTSEARATKAMAEAAVQASLNELAAARLMGAQFSHGQCLSETELETGLRNAMATLQPFAAERFIPREDPDTGNVPVVNDANAPTGTGAIDWRWGNLDDIARQAVDHEVKTAIANTLRDKAPEVLPPDGIKHVVIPAEWLPGLGPDMAPGGVPIFDLHVRVALLDYCSYLQGEGIHAVELALVSPAQPPAPVPDAGVQDAGAPSAGIPSVDAGVPDATVLVPQ
jgi:hypothetical protein